jgi:uncharacterized sporulation protein YeaH/YhbH (DUF444 family)
VSDPGGQGVSIPKRNTHEPFISHGRGGRKEIVSPGNKEFSQGDKIMRPSSGGGQGGGAGDQAGGEDDFSFELSREEYLDILFDGLELPNMQAKKKTVVESEESCRAGYSCDGIPGNLSYEKTFGNALATRVVRRSKIKKEIAALEAEGGREEEIGELEEKLRKLPLKIEDHHLRYRNFEKKPKAITQCVMFCVMDVSASMSKFRKEMAKRFFILLHTFLTTSYDRVEIVFVRHHVEAAEVDEDEFFYGKETGGTIVSSALLLTEEIINKRYSPSDWNIYVAQASDGDDWPGDPGACLEVLDRLIPRIQYMAYIEIADEPQELWRAYETLEQQSFQQARVQDADDILPVFRELFKRRES